MSCCGWAATCIRALMMAVVLRPEARPFMTRLLPFELTLAAAVELTAPHLRLRAAGGRSPPAPCDATSVSSVSADQLQDRCRQVVGLGEHGGRRLHQDLLLGEVGERRGHVRVTDGG